MQLIATNFDSIADDQKKKYWNLFKNVKCDVQ